MFTTELHVQKQMDVLINRKLFVLRKLVHFIAKEALDDFFGVDVDFVTLEHHGVDVSST